MRSMVLASMTTTRSSLVVQCQNDLMAIRFPRGKKNDMVATRFPSEKKNDMVATRFPSEKKKRHGGH